VDDAKERRLAGLDTARGRSCQAQVALRFVVVVQDLQVLRGSAGCAAAQALSHIGIVPRGDLHGQT